MRMRRRGSSSSPNGLTAAILPNMPLITRATMLTHNICDSAGAAVPCGDFSHTARAHETNETVDPPADRFDAHAGVLRRPYLRIAEHFLPRPRGSRGVHGDAGLPVQHHG